MYGAKKVTPHNIISKLFSLKYRINTSKKTMRLIINKMKKCQNILIQVQI